MTAAVDMIADLVAWLRTVAPGARLIADSRNVSRGDVFVAFPGDATDGRMHIADAVARGAAAVLAEARGLDWKAEWRVAHREVEDLKQHAGKIASLYLGQPDSAMFSVAVTGTNGKTSCSQWLGCALSILGTPTAVIGTLGTGLFRNGRHAGLNATGFTTPDAITLQHELARLRDAGAGAVAIEASSIGLHQGRMNGMHVDVAVFTNFTRDHLDYHGDMAAYEAAKRILFDWPGLAHAVLNLDDDMGVRTVEHLRRHARAVQLIGYTTTGRTAEGVAVLSASDLRATHGGTSFRLDSPFGVATIRTQLVGRFNVSNVLAVIGVLQARGIAFKAALGAVEALTPAPGRMEQMGGQDAPLVVIDYAHTPDALEQALKALRPVAEQRGGKLRCVFGCGGDRDPGKRPQMGAVAQWADVIVVTSDNPRSEDPQAIIDQIVVGIAPERTANGTLQVIEDRAQAILSAIRHAGRNDVVLVAGKGHESYQEIKGKKMPFLDADHAALALAARVTMKGMN